MIITPARTVAVRALKQLADRAAELKELLESDDAGTIPDDVLLAASDNAEAASLRLERVADDLAAIGPPQ